MDTFLVSLNVTHLIIFMRSLPLLFCIFFSDNTNNVIFLIELYYIFCLLYFTNKLFKKKEKKSIGSLNLFERFFIWFHILNRFINSAWRVDLKGVIQLNGLSIETSCSIRDIHWLKGWRVGLRNENRWQARIHCFDGFHLQSDGI